MKIQTKVYRSLTGEPFATQEINGKQVEFFYMNDTNYMAQYVQKGRFYIWTSDGKGYRLLIERGFYDKVSYFFTEEINEIWLSFLDSIGEVNRKLQRIFLFGSLGLSIVIITLGFFFDFVNIAVIVALLITFVSNMIHTSQLNKIIKEKNYTAQMKIRDLMGEDQFNKLIEDQDEYAKEFFEFKDDEFDDQEFDEFDEETKELEHVENTDDEVEVVEAEIVEEEIDSKE